MTTPPNTTFTIRRAVQADAPAIAALIDSLMPFLLLNPDGAGAEKFREAMAQKSIEGYIADPGCHYQVAFVDGLLGGVVAVRDTTHLFHLFVSRAFHRQGLGTRLWQAGRDQAIAAGNRQGFTVKSSDYALPLYERLGFVASEARVEKDGVAYVPMYLKLDSASA